MARKLLTLVSIASLLACVLLVALWIRGAWRGDVVALSDGHTTFSINAENGVLRRKRLGQCISCGYDVRASTDRCPECGVPVTSPA